MIISQQALELLKAFKIGFNPINKPISSKPTKFKIIPIIPTMANQNVKDFIIFFIRSHSFYKTQFTATMIIKVYSVVYLASAYFLIIQRWCCAPFSAYPRSTNAKASYPMSILSRPLHWTMRKQQPPCLHNHFLLFGFFVSAKAGVGI